jgi:hypothetical protein
MQPAALLVGLVCLACVMEPVHARTVMTADNVLDAWRARLPVVAMASVVTGLISGWLTSVRSTSIAGALAFPMAFYTGFAWVFYGWLTGLASNDPGTAAELASRAAPLLTLVTRAAANPCVGPQTCS